MIVVNGMDAEVSNMAEPPQVIEGTGEELEAYLKLQPKQRFRLTPLTSNETDAEQIGGPPEETSLAELLAGRVGRFHFGDANLSQNSGKKFAALIAEKKKQGRL
jgi:hypothetical protein